MTKINSVPEFKHKKSYVLRAPIIVNLEITSACNLKCRHCYNFWREDEKAPIEKFDIARMDAFVDRCIEAKVFHVVLSGGEPFANFNVLEHGLRRLHDAGLSTSVNSNLMLTTPDKMKRLRDAGMDHVLTSLNSHDPTVNDYMVNKPGAHEKILRGIRETRDAGIRVSANMIISEPNQNHVYETARLCVDLGVQRLFATRLVPSVTVENPEETDFRLDHDSAMRAINDMLRAKEDFGIGIGTLISYPLCLLGDLRKYKDFVGRGCPAERGNRMIVNGDGQAHACTHEEVPYGNIFEEGIQAVFQRMTKWHDGSYFFEGCKDCRYINVCGSGCRSAAFSYYKDMAAKDPLFLGHKHIEKDFEFDVGDVVLGMIDRGEAFVVPETIRWRQENDFYTLNVRWANAFSVSTELANFLMDKQKKQEPITISNMMGGAPRDTLIRLVYKEAIVPMDAKVREAFNKGLKPGCSIDPSGMADDVPF